MIYNNKMLNNQISTSVNHIFIQFNTSHNGRLSVSQLTNYYNSFNRHNAIPFVFDEYQVKDIHRSFDQNRDWQVSFDEYMAHLKKYSNQINLTTAFYPDLRDREDENMKRKISQLFIQFDQNKSGRLDRQELKKYYNFLYTQAGIPYQITDKQVDAILNLYGQPANGGFDMFDFYYIVKSFKNFPKYI